MKKRAPWLALLLSIGLSFAASAEGAPVSKAGGAIDNDVVWHGAVLVESRVQVMAGGRLTILPGAEIRFSKGAGLAVSGALRAVGTADAPIRFRSAEPVPAPGDWNGILLAGSAGDVVLRHASVADAEAIQVGGGVPEISGCTIERGLTGIFVGKNAQARISGNVITDMAYHGIDCQSGATPSIDNNVIRRCAKFGILSQRNASPAVTGNGISGCNCGVLYSSAAPPPERNRLDSNEVGIALNNIGNGMVVSRNRFTGNACGLRVENFSSPRIEGNDFDNNGVGIFCYRSSSPEIVRNRIVGNKDGIACSQMSAPLISANEISGNRTGVLLTLSSYARVNGNNLDNDDAQVKLDFMSYDWEIKAGRKPERGVVARHQTMVGKGRAIAGRGIEGVDPDAAAGTAGFVDATGNWWGARDTAEMEAKGKEGNIGSLIDGCDVQTRTYKKYPGEFVQDRVDFAGWKNAPIDGAGIPESGR